MLLLLGFLNSRRSSRGFTEWSILSLCVSVCVWVCVLRPETVSQREKIDETSVTGTSPSAFAHMHKHAHAHAHPSHRHIAFPPHTCICAHFLTHCSASLHSLCTQSRILMCSLRALLSVCVTFHPSTHHFQPHHQIQRKQFSTNSPFIQRFIQSLHRLRWHSTTSTFHHLHIIMRHYAALLYVSLYHFKSLIYPPFHFDWNITLKLQCTSLRAGNPLTENFFFFSGTAFICTRGISTCVCMCMRACVCGHVCMFICMHVKYRNTKKREERWSVSACTFTHAHQPGVDYRGVSGN